MLATTKSKWFGSIVLAGILLCLALVGGKWGSTYSANASVYVAPHIDSIIPSSVPAGSADTLMIIIGSDFGTLDDTRVRLTGIGIDELLTPLQVIPDGISVMIPADLLAEPVLYILTVVKSDPGTIPTIPITPWDEESNPVPFKVYLREDIYLPIITK